MKETAQSEHIEHFLEQVLVVLLCAESCLSIFP